MNSWYSSFHWIYWWIENMNSYDFMYMNLAGWILRWIHIYEFWCMISRYFSWSCIQIWIHIMNSYKMIMNSYAAFHDLYEFMPMKSYMKSGCQRSRWSPWRCQLAQPGPRPGGRLWELGGAWAHCLHTGTQAGQVWGRHFLYFGRFCIDPFNDSTMKPQEKWYMVIWRPVSRKHIIFQ